MQVGELSTEAAVGVAKVAPPAAVVAANVFGVSVPDLINAMTLIYLTGLLVQMAWRFGRKAVTWWMARE